MQMDALFLMLKNVIIFVCLAIPGVILSKIKLLKIGQTAVLSNVLMYVGMPFLIFNSTLKITFNSELIKLIFWVFCITIMFIILTFFMSFISCVKMPEEDASNSARKGMAKFCSVFSNNGFLGLPLALAIFGNDSQIFIFVIIINILTNTFMYTLGIYLVTGDRKAISIKVIICNPIIISFLIGTICNLLKLAYAVPEVTTYTTHLSNLVTPLSMLILGAKLGEIRFIKLLTNLRMYLVSLIKLILVPVVVVAICILFNFAKNVVLAMYIGFSMPTAGLAPTFADKFNGDSEGAVCYTLGSTILSTVTIPFLFWLLSIFI